MTEATLIEETAKEIEGIYRQINLNRCEVWCPSSDGPVCVHKACIRDESTDTCKSFVLIHYTGKVLCAYPAVARGREDS